MGTRKMAGILAEATTEARGVDSVVVGIGINVNLDLGQLPPPVADTATSLLRETGRVHDVVSVVAAVLGRWVVWYDALQRDRACVLEAWRERSIDWWGQAVEVESGGRRISGVARDIDEAGGLLIETADGKRVAVVSGEARALRATAERHD